MVSDKSYAVEQRLNVLVASLGNLPSLLSSLTSRVAALEALEGDTSWTDTGSMTGGWGKGSGYFKYKKLSPNVVAVAAKALTLGTVADGTTILTNANGLQSGYQPGTAQQLVATTNSLKGSPVTSGGFEPAWLEFEPAGSVQCFGCVLAGTFVNCFGLLFTDI